MTTRLQAADAVRAQVIVDTLAHAKPSETPRASLLRFMEKELARARGIGECSERLRTVLYLREMASEEPGDTGASERIAHALEEAAQYIENGAHPKVKEVAS